MKRTPFYDGTIHQPVRNGIYQRRRPVHQHVANKPARMQVKYALFEGGIWYCEASSPALAELVIEESAYQSKAEWRGLSEQAA